MNSIRTDAETKTSCDSLQANLSVNFYPTVGPSPQSALAFGIGERLETVAIGAILSCVR
jgi:hypothetical protein